MRLRDTNLSNRLHNASKALVRSLGGVEAGLAFSTCPLCSHPLGAALVPNPSPASSSSSRPSFWAQLPVWPSTRFQWPPPRALCPGWGLGAEGVCLGECCGPDLPRSWRQNHDQCHASRSGFGRAESVRHETFRGGGGRPPSFWRCPFGFRHHDGQCSTVKGSGFRACRCGSPRLTGSTRARKTLPAPPIYPHSNCGWWAGE